MNCTRGTAAHSAIMHPGRRRHLMAGVFSDMAKLVPFTTNVLLLIQASWLAVSGEISSDPLVYMCTSTEATSSESFEAPPLLFFFFFSLSFLDRLVTILFRALLTGSCLFRRRRYSFPFSRKRRLRESSPSTERTWTVSRLSLIIVRGCGKAQRVNFEPRKDHAYFCTALEAGSHVFCVSPQIQTCLH